MIKIVVWTETERYPSTLKHQKVCIFWWNLIPNWRLLFILLGIMDVLRRLKKGHKWRGKNVWLRTPDCEDQQAFVGEGMLWIEFVEKMDWRSAKTWVCQVCVSDFGVSKLKFFPAKKNTISIGACLECLSGSWDIWTCMKDSWNWCVDVFWLLLNYTPSKLTWNHETWKCPQKEKEKHLQSLPIFGEPMVQFFLGFRIVLLAHPSGCKWSQGSYPAAKEIWWIWLPFVPVWIQMVAVHSLWTKCWMDLITLKNFKTSCSTWTLGIRCFPLCCVWILMMKWLTDEKLQLQ